jgi:hypothetical protein
MRPFGKGRGYNNMAAVLKFSTLFVLLLVTHEQLQVKSCMKVKHNITYETLFVLPAIKGITRMLQRDLCLTNLTHKEETSSCAQKQQNNNNNIHR